VDRDLGDVMAITRRTACPTRGMRRTQGYLDAKADSG